MTVNDASGEDRRIVRTENPNEFYVMLRPASTDPGLEIGSSDEEKLEIGSWAEEMLEIGLKEANDDLRGKGSGWRLESEPGPEHRIVVPVKVTHPPQLTATRVTLGLTDLSDELHKLTTPIEMVVDPLIFRFPGHKPTFSAFGLSAPPSRRGQSRRRHRSSPRGRPGRPAWAGVLRHASGQPPARGGAARHEGRAARLAG